MKTNFVLILVFDLILLLPIDSMASEEKDSIKVKQKLVWINSGLGAGVDGFAAEIGCSFNLSNSIISLHFIFISEADFDFGKSVPLKSFNDIGVLYGWISKTKSILASFSGGISYFRGVSPGNFLRYNRLKDRTEYEEIRFQAIGIPLKVSLIWPITAQFGIGIQAYGNINKEQSIVSMLLTFHLGKLQSK